jgi:hypothetical protein
LEVDPRVLVEGHGAKAFPFSVVRVAELRAEAAAKAGAALKQLYDGTVSFPIKAPDGSAVTLAHLLSSYSHVALIFSDGDNNDPNYKAVEDAVVQINTKQAGNQVAVYLGWLLYEGGDHTLFAERFHSVLDVKDDLRSALADVAGSPNFCGLLNLRRGSGVCNMDGTCEAEGVPVMVSKDAGFQRLREGRIHS